MLGPNGAGKTTTVEILEGYRTRDAGRVSILGMDPSDAGTELRRRIGIVLQSCGFEAYLTVAEMLRMHAGYYPHPRPVDEVLALVGPRGEGREPRAHALGRPAAPARRGPGPRRRPGAAVPRRADHRLRPDRAPAGLGRDPRPVRPRQDGPADHPLHGRGAGAGRPDRRRPRRHRSSPRAAPTSWVDGRPARSRSDSRSTPPPSSRRPSTSRSATATSSSCARPIPCGCCTRSPRGRSTPAPRSVPSRSRRRPWRTCTWS